MRRLIVTTLICSLSQVSTALAQGPQEPLARAEQGLQTSPSPQTSSKKVFLWTGMAITSTGIGLFADTFLKEECITRAGAPGTNSECLQTTTHAPQRALGAALLGLGAALLTVSAFKSIQVGPGSLTLGPNSAAYRVRF
jgi:hypothetical protein